MKKKHLLIQLLILIGVTILGYLLWTLIFAGFTPVESETVIEPFTGASMLFGFITAIITLLIISLNNVNILKQRVKQTLNNITVTNKRSVTLLEKANKVVDKYMDFEKDVVSTISKSKKNKITKRIVNANSFEQRINEYPELKSNTSIMELLNQIRESENIVANFKLEHNEFVARYNNEINSFPAVLFKSIMKNNEFEFYNDDSDIISDEKLGI